MVLGLLQKLTFVGQDLVKLKICLSRRGSVVLARVNNWLSSLSRLLMNDFDRNYNHKFSSSPIHSSPWRREVSVAKKVFSIYLSISVVKQVLLIVFIEYRLYWLSTTYSSKLATATDWLTDWQSEWLQQSRAQLCIIRTCLSITKYGLTIMLISLKTGMFHT